MAKAKGSGVLKVVKVKKACTIRIDSDLDDEITQFEERLKNEAPNHVFDRSSIVEDALRDALDQARAELDDMVPGRSSSESIERVAS